MSTRMNNLNRKALNTLYLNRWYLVISGFTLRLFLGPLPFIAVNIRQSISVAFGMTCTLHHSSHNKIPMDWPDHLLNCR